MPPMDGPFTTPGGRAWAESAAHTQTIAPAANMTFLCICPLLYCGHSASKTCTPGFIIRLESQRETRARCHGTRAGPLCDGGPAGDCRVRPHRHADGRAPV